MGDKVKPKFTPKPGQVDYSNARWAPVVNCVVKYEDKILIVQRSKDLNFYPDYWASIDGFLDDKKTLEEKVQEELREEIGVNRENIKSIQLASSFDYDEPKYEKTWIVHPVLVEVSTDTVRLDWEAQDYKWVKPEEVKNFNLMPGFNKVIGTFFQ